jgi:hypothetical protein
MRKQNLTQFGFREKVFAGAKSVPLPKTLGSNKKNTSEKILYQIPMMSYQSSMVRKPV